MEGNNIPEKVHSQMLRAGSQNYFFDVKKSTKGNNYLTIAQSYKDKNGQSVVNRIMLFKEHFPDFSKTLTEIENYL
jgi:hypothetical protein